MQRDPSASRSATRMRSGAGGTIGASSLWRHGGHCANSRRTHLREFAKGARTSDDRGKMMTGNRAPCNARRGHAIALRAL